MKKLILSILFILCLSFQASALGPMSLMSGMGTSGGGDFPVCDGSTGSFTAGDPEDFEHASGDGYFCTDDWAVTDTDGIISTAAASNPKCGSNSASIVYDSDNANANVITASLDAPDADGYIRFYYTVPDVEDWKVVRALEASSDTTPGANIAFYIKITDWSTGGTAELLRLVGEDVSANEYTVTPGSLYRIEVHFVHDDTCTIRVYDSAGDAVNHDGAAAETTVTAFDQDIQHFQFVDTSDSAATCTGYIDAMEYGSTDWLGAVTCNP